MTAAEELKNRTMALALRVIRLCSSLPPTPAARVIANQLLRSGTSVGANYRTACLARSRPDFSSKIAITLEEADETVYWLELLVQGKFIDHHRVDALLAEARQLVAIFAASRITATEKQRR